MRSIISLLVGAILTGAALASDSNVLADYGDLEIATSVVPQKADHRAPSTSKSGNSARAKGVSWLERNQLSDGGWSSGVFGSQAQAGGSDVATTSAAVLALHRDAAGSSTHKAAIEKGVAFVIDAAMNAPSGPRLRTPEGTQVQYKLGQLADTHFAALMLGEVTPTLSGDLRRRADTAYDVVLEKVQLAQNADGSFDGNGWAPVLSSSIAAQSLNVAVANGRDVKDEVLKRSDEYQAAAQQGGSFDSSSGAGVELYAVASALRTNSQSQERSKAPASAPVAQKARATEAAAVAAVAGDSGALVAGFGSIGGEEMLSYMMISDTLSEKGGSEWRDWDNKIGDYLGSVQNEDGSWVGHHCITSQAFTTAAAVLTLTAGATPARG